MCIEGVHVEVLIAAMLLSQDSSLVYLHKVHPGDNMRYSSSHFLIWSLKFYSWKWQNMLRSPN